MSPTWHLYRSRKFIRERDITNFLRVLQTILFLISFLFYSTNPPINCDYGVRTAIAGIMKLVTALGCHNSPKNSKDILVSLAIIFKSEIQRYHCHNGVTLAAVLLIVRRFSINYSQVDNSKPARDAGVIRRICYKREAQQNVERLSWSYLIQKTSCLNFVTLSL
jgi:hypothetical protein